MRTGCGFPFERETDVLSKTEDPSYVVQNVELVNGVGARDWIFKDDEGMQERIVVQCVNCGSFQVQAVKKKNNGYSCPACGQKQSIRHVHAIGHDAKELRELVQRLNQERIEKEESRAQRSVKPTEILGGPGGDFNAETVTDTTFWDAYLSSREVSPELDEEREEDARYVTVYPERKPARKGRKAWTGIENGRKRTATDSKDPSHKTNSWNVHVDSDSNRDGEQRSERDMGESMGGAMTIPNMWNDFIEADADEF